MMKDAEHEFEVWQDGIPVATSAAVNRAAALREIRHYAAVYGQDGPVEVVEVVRTPVDLASLNTSDPSCSKTEENRTLEGGSSWDHAPAIGSALERIVGLLGSALSQALPSDDQIIISNVRSAHELAKHAWRLSR